MEIFVYYFLIIRYVELARHERILFFPLVTNDMTYTESYCWIVRKQLLGESNDFVSVD